MLLSIRTLLKTGYIVLIGDPVRTINYFKCLTTVAMRIILPIYFCLNVHLFVFFSLSIHFYKETLNRIDFS